jgi:hypothetical protein
MCPKPKFAATDGGQFGSGCGPSRPSGGVTVTDMKPSTTSEASPRPRAGCYSVHTSALALNRGAARTPGLVSDCGSRGAYRVAIAQVRTRCVSVVETKSVIGLGFIMRSKSPAL